MLEIKVAMGVYGNSFFLFGRAENSELEFLKRMDEIILLTSMSKKRTETPSSQDCECKEIVESVAVPLSQHYLALGDYSRAFYYLLESASAYVNLSHNYMVSRITHSFLTPSLLLQRRIF